jgi:carboxylesterase type B
MGINISYTTTPHTLSLGAKGSIVGVKNDDKAIRYAGVPYALPPTGDRRWRKPVPLPASYSYTTGTGLPFDASKFGPICAQNLKYTSAGKHEDDERVFNEDCLRMNIWTPVAKKGDEDRKWPVMLWLHGGWFQMGDPSHEPGMDPTELISSGNLDAIVVAIGYRLNVFGFLAGAELQAESEIAVAGAGNVATSVGNYGLWDQRLAMEWVVEHIGAFGGDIENITLAGRSAGAYAVHAHALYAFQHPEERKLFHRIVMISNAIPAQPKTPTETQPQFDELCAFFNIQPSLSGASKLAKLRKISHEELIECIAQLTNHTFRPVTDGLFILPDMIQYHQSGAFARRFTEEGFRLFVGEMLNEETLYAATNSPQANRQSLYEQVVNYYAPEVTERVLEYYPLPISDKKEDWVHIYGIIISDGQVRAPSRFLADTLFGHGVGVEDIWRYRIAYRLSFITEKVAPKSFGVAHAMDKPIWKYVRRILKRS